MISGLPSVAATTLVSAATLLEIARELAKKEGEKAWAHVELARCLFDEGKADAVARMVERLPGLRFAGDPAELEWMPSLASRGLVKLEVEHDAR